MWRPSMAACQYKTLKSLEIKELPSCLCAAGTNRPIWRAISITGVPRHTAISPSSRPMCSSRWPSRLTIAGEIRSVHDQKHTLKVPVPDWMTVDFVMVAGYPAARPLNARLGCKSRNVRLEHPLAVVLEDWIGAINGSVLSGQRCTIQKYHRAWLAQQFHENLVDRSKGLARRRSVGPSASGKQNSEMLDRRWAAGRRLCGSHRALERPR